MILDILDSFSRQTEERKVTAFSKSLPEAHNISQNSQDLTKSGIASVFYFKPE